MFAADCTASAWGVDECARLAFFRGPIVATIETECREYDCSACKEGGVEQEASGELRVLLS